MLIFVSCKTLTRYHLQYVYPSDKPCYVCVLLCLIKPDLGISNIFIPFDRT